MNLNLKDKVIVIGGGEGSVGKALVRFLTEEGAVPISLDIALGHDLSDAKAVAVLFADLKVKYEKISGFCSTVYGGSTDNEPLKVSSEDIEGSLKHTLLAALYPAQEAARWMCQTGGGGIVMVSSINSVLGTGSFAYDISKGALNRVAPDFATTCGPQGVYTSSLLPGTIAPSAAWDNNPEGLKQISATIPDGRATTPDEVAATIAFFLSDHGRMFNGSTVIADRGWSLMPRIQV